MDDANFIPEADPRYRDGKIYKLTNSITDEMYVGSTVQEITTRLSEHRKYATFHTCKVYTRMREIGSQYFQIHLVEAYPCASRTELRMREEHWIQQIQPSLNTVRAYLSEEQRKELNNIHRRQYHHEHREAALAKMKQYAIDHREEIAARKQAYRAENQEQIKEYMTQYREERKDYLYAKVREYNEVNKAAIAERAKNRYAANKAAILARQQEKVLCPECNAMYSRGNIPIHRRSAKHIRNAERLQELQEEAAERLHAAAARQAAPVAAAQ